MTSSAEEVRLKPCPFCGKEPFRFGDGSAQCRSPKCPLQDTRRIPLELWNSRPELREGEEENFVDLLYWYQHEATVSTTLTIARVVELFAASRLFAHKGGKG